MEMALYIFVLTFLFFLFVGFILSKRSFKTGLFSLGLISLISAVMMFFHLEVEEEFVNYFSAYLAITASFSAFVIINVIAGLLKIIFRNVYGFGKMVIGNEEIMLRITY